MPLISELFKIMTTTGSKMTPSEAEEMLTTIAYDGRRKISVRDFMKMLSGTFSVNMAQFRRNSLHSFRSFRSKSDK